MNEKRLRLTGYLVITSLFFIFFMMDMLFTWKVAQLQLKIVFITILFSVLVWEPTRAVILLLRRRLPGLINLRSRVMWELLILIPYACLLGCARVYLEDLTLVWGVRVASLGNYLYTIGVCMLFILLEAAVYEGAYFFVEWNRARNEAEELKKINMQVQLDLLKVQIQPHFLFNTLNTLIGLIELRPKDAIDFTEKLAYIYRYLLEANDRTLIELEEEVRFVRAFFSLLKTRYGNALHMQIDIPGDQGFELPPLSLQILLENAVKHNAMTQARPLNFLVTLDEEENSLCIMNNIQLRDSVSGTGKGLPLLKKKFALLNLPPVEISSSRSHFVVTLPLVKRYSYESIDR
ncbi:sensor histidine kinase [Flavihumibacter petaseus]|uniref:Putative two-component histidine kinase n=1 Tax=Flavihumibacter petaseus NBRC 106054 TaxID=1220578 RepID=A0A0E9N4L9_9BACT|nr:histidine kinase [Flavihumibacter petaseus]GAO44892.1 putative two-component histidine kinase [Flavihumibacter petaseus NBRC 106054]